MQQSALAAAWRCDVPAGQGSMPQAAFAQALAYFGAAIAADGTGAGAAACLQDLLPRLQQGGRWQQLLSTAKADGATKKAPAKKAAAKGGKPKPGSATDDEIDALFSDSDGEPDVAAASDRAPPSKPKPPAVSKTAAPKAAVGLAPEASVMSVRGDNDGLGDGDDDGASLGLSCAASRVMSAKSAYTVGGDDDLGELEVDAEDGKANKVAKARAAARAKAAKDIDDPALAAECSVSSALSDGGGAEPDFERQLSNTLAHASGSPSKQRGSVLKSVMATEEGKGGLADMPVDLKQWSQFKDKAHGPAMPMRPRGMAAGGQAKLVSLSGDILPGHGGASPARGGSDPRSPGAKMSPLHSSVIGSGASRHSLDRGLQGSASRGSHGSYGSQVSRGSGMRSGRQPSYPPGMPGPRPGQLSRGAVSLSEPGGASFTGGHGALPTVQHGGKLMPGHSPGASPSKLSVMAGQEGPKLPLLPGLRGAQGSSPKAMEQMRRGSMTAAGQGQSGHRSFKAAHLPAVGGGCGGGRMQPSNSYAAGAAQQAMAALRRPSAKALDNYF